jgi:hypothetical protein
MRIYKAKKEYYVTYIMNHISFNLENVSTPGFKLRLWHSLLIYNGGMCRIPGVYYFDELNHLNEMLYMSSIFEENSASNHTNYLEDERLVKSYHMEYLHIIGENNSTRILKPYLQKVENVLCLNLNVQITD